MKRSVANSTNRTYAVAWNDWRIFCDARGENPVLVGGHTEESRKDEERLLQFSVYLADSLSRAAGAVKNKLMSLK